MKSSGNFRCDGETRSDGVTAVVVPPSGCELVPEIFMLKTKQNEDVNKAWSRRGWRVKEELGIGCCARDG